jgi:hypothetical protein
MNTNAFSNHTTRQIGRRGTSALIAVVLAAATFAPTACGSTPNAAAQNSSASSASAPADDLDLVSHTPGLVVPTAIHVPPGADPAQARNVVHAAQLLYTFWNTGDTTYLDHAITSDFRTTRCPRAVHRAPLGRRSPPPDSAPRYRT